MKKIRSQTPPRRTVSLSERWPLGWNDLIKEAANLGFEPWVPQHSRLFADWTKQDFAMGPAAWKLKPNAEDSGSYAYISRDAILTLEQCQASFEQFSFVVLDDRHPLVESLKADAQASRSLVVVNFADAFVDWLSTETWMQEWVATEWVSARSKISYHARLEPGVLVGPDAVIEDGVLLRAGCRVGAGVRIGAGTEVGAHAVILDHVQVGQDVLIGPHCVLGAPGFGLLKYPAQSAPKLRVHVGSVVVGDRVRMGAYVSVDRGVFENTVIGADSQFDNHVQVGHNCQIGESGVFCAFVGLGGSTNVGSRTTLAGFVGSKGHLTIGNDVVVGAQSGITRDLQDGEQVKGYPVRSMGEAIKIAVLTAKLPEIYDRLKKIEKSEKNGKG